ncbi:helix-hairpin-helix domain-containing protein [Dyadobacter sandarakinus]|uniref:Helix-hairpin-helix domain-containing protein n=1 Tax=Dyadobacter sandarakinus TaxID=2747268 RepID=A0ABX7I6Q0_9BACT|nr:helix-hairpin-helix domain-containing protein [Dyadobacter sandarakinus]QRR01575.1 hypothetical protein HWI92_12000 [Dyadobacter sandarakinus]
MTYAMLTHTQEVAISTGVLLVLLCAAAFVGWIMGGKTADQKVNELSELVEVKKAALEEARLAKKPKNEAIVATHASKVVYPAAPEPHAPDDLTIIDGIGPRTAELLNKEGIQTFEQLAEASILRIARILKNAGPRFQVQDPTLWPKQAKLAHEKKWEELEKLKTLLISGK